jgi:hypothetical protein
MPLYRKFFDGPKVLRSLDHLAIESNIDTVNFVTFIGDYDPDIVFATKNFRKMNQKIPNGVFQINFWYIESKELAEKLKINSAGDIYMIVKK